MATVLKDPESARYRFGEPQRAYVNNGLLRGGNVVWQGYVIYFFVNAKNSYGGYTGEQPWFALVYDTVISKVDTADHDSSPYILFGSMHLTYPRFLIVFGYDAERS